MIVRYRTKRHRIEALPITDKMLRTGKGWPVEFQSAPHPGADDGDWLVREVGRHKERGPWVLITPENFWDQFEEDKPAELRRIG